MYYDNPLMLGHVRLLWPIWWQVPQRWNLILSPWSSTYSNADKPLLVKPRDPTGLPLVAIGTRSLIEIWLSIYLSNSFWRILCSEDNKFARLSCKRALLSWKLDITGRCGGCARARCPCASKSFTCNTLSALRIAFILCEHGMPWTWLNAPVQSTWCSNGG